MKTLDDLELDLYTLASAIAGPEPWGDSGFYAADFGILTDDRGDYEALTKRIDTEHEDHPDMKKTVGAHFSTRVETTCYLIGENSSWGLTIRIVGPMRETTRQDRITALETELAELKADAA